MSKSKGNVMALATLLEVLPPEVVRYFYFRTDPNKHKDFDPREKLLPLVEEYERTQGIAVASTPPAATVKVDGLETTTPGSVDLRRNREHTMVFTKDGFPDRDVKLESGPSAWLLGNLIFGGLIGLIIDFVSGGAYKLSPASVDMDMATGTAKKVEK